MKKSKPKKKKVKKINSNTEFAIFAIPVKEILKKKEEFDKRWGKANEGKFFDLIKANLKT